MKKYKINVTENDILLGVRHNCQKCPIARALSRAMRTPCGAGSLGGWWKIRENKVRMMPKEASKFINRYDQYDSVKPFKFTVTV